MMSKVFLIFLLFVQSSVLFARPTNIPKDAKLNDEGDGYLYEEVKNGLSILTIWDTLGELQSISKTENGNLKEREVTVFFNGRWSKRLKYKGRGYLDAESLPPDWRAEQVPKEAAFNFDFRKWEYGKTSNGKKEGEWKLWWPTGEAGGTITYSAGLYNGKLRTIWENGSKYEEVTYVNGKKEGDFKSYYENGKPWEICGYKADLMHGIRIKYNEKGKLAFRDQFENGKVIKQETFDPKYATGKENTKKK